MIRFETAQTIARSADEIWTYAVDVLRHPEWMAVTDARILQGQGSEVGARGRERLMLGPFRWDVEFVVTQATPGRRIVWRSVAGAPFYGDIALDLTPIGADTTRATYGASVQMRGLWRLLAPLIAMEGKAGQARELQRLKEQVEGVPAIAPAVA